MPEYSAIYEDAVDRIQASYSTCSVAEQKMMTQILQEMATTGYSYTLEQIWLSDFTAIPVGIDQFLDDPYYLGGTNDCGKAVYPFWRQTFRKVFDAGNKYNEIIFSGATRLGKTSSAITIMAYMLYRLMLYRDPHKYFAKKAVSKFTLAFANLTKDLAFGVGYREFNDTLKEVPWFMDRGKITRSDRNFYYLPEGDKIEIIAASDSAQLLGKQLWACLKGDTQLLTSEGVKSIESCQDTTQTILQYIEGELVPVDATIQLTKYVSETIRIELEDGTVIEGTPDHKVMLSDGTYKCLGDLTSSDDLLTLNIEEEVDDMNLKDKTARFCVYEHVSPEGKRYVGITCKQPKDRWLAAGKGYKENAHFWSAIEKYGWDNFEHNILATDLSLEDACKMEVDLIAKYDLMNPDKGYNHTTGGNWSTPDEETRKKLSTSLKARGADPEYRRKLSVALKGHVVSEETKRKISEANKGMQISEKERERRRNYRHSPETIEKMRKQVAWNKGLTKEDDERVAHMAEARRGIPMSEEQKELLSSIQKARFKNGFAPRWINNGEVEKQIQENEDVPEGFTYGRLRIKDTYVHKGIESKKVSQDELNAYLDQGWIIGRPESIKETIRKSLQTMHWEYDNLSFDTAFQLAEYLHSHGYPDIVDSTITSLYKKGFNKSPKYHTLEGKIRKILHEDKINSAN